MFSPKGKMCVDFASYIIFTFEVALVHLPVFTESCVWDAFSRISIFICVSCHLIEKKITKQISNEFKGYDSECLCSAFLSLGHRLARSLPVLLPAVLGYPPLQSNVTPKA